MPWHADQSGHVAEGGPRDQQLHGLSVCRSGAWEVLAIVVAHLQQLLECHVQHHFVGYSRTLCAALHASDAFIRRVVVI